MCAVVFECCCVHSTSQNDQIESELVVCVTNTLAMIKLIVAALVAEALPWSFTRIEVVEGAQCMQLGKTGVGWLGARSLGAGAGGIDAWAIQWIDNPRLPCHGR